MKIPARRKSVSCPSSKLVRPMGANGNLELNVRREIVDVRKRELLDDGGLRVDGVVLHGAAQLRELAGVKGQIKGGAGGERLQVGRGHAEQVLPQPDEPATGDLHDQLRVEPTVGEPVLGCRRTDPPQEVLRRPGEAEISHRLIWRLVLHIEVDSVEYGPRPLMDGGVALD